MSVELGPDRVKDALDRAYTGLSRTVKLKGYRAGHVPRRLVERFARTRDAKLRRAILPLNFWNTGLKIPTLSSKSG